MTSTALDYPLLLKWRQALILSDLIRNIPANVSGGARRLEILDKIIKIQETTPEEVKADIKKRMEWACELVLNREHLGAMKVGLLALWGGQSSVGATQEQIREVARALRIWEKHIRPVVGKDDTEAIAELDDEADLGDLDDAPADEKAP